MLTLWITYLSWIHICRVAECQSFYTDKTFSSKFTQKSVFIQRARIHVNLQDFTPDLEIIYTDISAISVTLCNFGFMRQEWGENL